VDGYFGAPALSEAARFASLPCMTADPGVRVQRMGRADEGELARFQDAFDNEVISEETKRFLADDRHHMVLGYVNDRPAGFASAVEVFHPDKRCELFLNEIAVMEGGRRRGVARALIRELKRLGRERGCVSMWVLTDEGNEPAMGLYRSTGGRWSGVPSVMFEYDLTTVEPTE
jgi:ribosomal protein S18 acetylase RimI-like enzyme